MTTRRALSFVAVAGVLVACDPTVLIGQPDAGAGGGLSSAGGFTTGGGTSGTGGGTSGGSTSGGSTSGGSAADPVCAHWATASATFFAGQSSCVGATNTITKDPQAASTCLAGIQQCTSADRQTLERYLTCLETGPRCTAGNETAAVNGFMTCTSTAFSTLSMTCRSALVRLRVAHKRIFVTRDRFTGALGGLTGADQKCNTAATAAGLTGSTFKAWLSSSTVNAIDRISDVAPWHDTEDLLLFPTHADLGRYSLPGPLWRDEYGQLLSTEKTWTGTGATGTYVAALSGTTPCSEWSSGAMSEQAKVGSIGRQDVAWTSFSNTTCDQLAHLICLEQ